MSNFKTEATMCVQNAISPKNSKKVITRTLVIVTLRYVFIRVDYNRLLSGQIWLH